MELNEETLARIIREVISEYTGATSEAPRKKDPSGVIAIDPAKIATEPFPFPIESPPGSVRLIDVMDTTESPRLGCGIMEMDSTSFEWTLAYDEIDYVIDGVLELVMDGRPVRASAGQILYIPKNTKLRFSAPGKVRFLYVVYPANWFEQ
ncbi:MAG: cupin domain-containing protein [Propionibacteriaceae bacterium]|jgi:ethanolamine utilization protein EutQ|nr:cupin domain-containing protein [Propionibacteriaceae bacterium]